MDLPCVLMCVAGLVCFRGNGVCGRGGQEGERCPMWPDVCDEGLACFNDPEVSPERLEKEHYMRGGGLSIGSFIMYT